MMRHGGHLWAKHPAVRSGDRLTVGERAADILKRYFGTWSALFAVAIWIAAWMLLQKASFAWDKAPYILLNLCLSCLAAVQGIILQISANRGDRISAEVALHTEGNTDTLVQLLQKNTDLTEQVHELQTAAAALLQSNTDLTRQVAALVSPSSSPPPGPPGSTGTAGVRPAAKGMGTRIPPKQA